MNANQESHQTKTISELDKIQDGVSYLTGQLNVSVRDLLPDKFIAEHTDFETLANFFRAAGIEYEKDLEKPAFNDFIKIHTRFEDWEEMLIQSSNQYTLSHLEE